MLLDIGKRNAIMMIEFCNYCAAKRGSDARADKCACRGFGRTTMMTMAAMIGTLPIALGLGVGAELRQPLGIAVVGVS